MKRYRITSFFNGHHIVLSLRKLFLDLRSVRYRICDARILVYHALYAFKSDVKKVIGLCASLISRLQNRAICSINLRAPEKKGIYLGKSRRVSKDTALKSRGRSESQIETINIPAYKEG